jgi:L-threonylcarbamoyladenylate synthase
VSDPIEQAAAAASAGRLIVFPTDTVYGIGTRPDDAAATDRLFEAKGRPRDLSLAVLVPSFAVARQIAAFDDTADRLVTRLWPGPLTVILPRTPASATWELGSDRDTIGVRMPHHPLSLAILARTGPLAVSSANRTGEPPAPDCDALSSAFGDRVGVYVCQDEPLPGAPSTVVEVARGELRVIRAGAVDRTKLLAALAG